MAMIDVAMADGRTVFRFRTRGQFIALIKRKPEAIDEERHVHGWARWQREDETFEATTLSYLRQNSVAYIRVLDRAERDAFEQEFPDARPRERSISATE